MRSGRAICLRAPRARRGLTLAELVLGMLVVALVASAVSAVAMAVSTGWKQSEMSSSATLSGSRAGNYLESVFRGSIALGTWRAGSVDSPAASSSALVLIWRGDRNGDRRIQVDELALIQHDVASAQLILYAADYPDAASRAAYNATLANSFLTDATAADAFKSKAYVVPQTIARRVTGAQFNIINRDSSTVRPTFVFVLKHQSSDGTSSAVQYGSASLRSATTQPS
jgi:hypothetical protein